MIFDKDFNLVPAPTFVSPEESLKYPFYFRHDWKAEDYFSDPKTLELCQAIKDCDIIRCQKLLESGANANAIGIDNMTLLLWAYPSGRDIMELLLKHGADPNVIFKSDFHQSRNYHIPTTQKYEYYLDHIPIDSSTMVHISAFTPDFEYLDLMLKYGGHANDHNEKFHYSPLLYCGKVTSSAQFENRLKLLLQEGVDINQANRFGTVLIRTLGLNEGEKKILICLENNGDPLIMYSGSAYIHTFVRQFDLSHKNGRPNKEQDEFFKKATPMLEAHGYSFAEARKDINFLSTSFDDIDPVRQHITEKLNKARAIRDAKIQKR